MRNLPFTIQSLSTRLHTPFDCEVITSTRHLVLSYHFPALCPWLTTPMPTTHREPLCLSVGVTNIKERVLHVLNQHYLIFFAHTGSCARPKSSQCLSFTLVHRVFAGCCEPLLEDGPSRRYLCDLCIGAWVRTPPRLISAFIRFFLISFGLPLGSRGSAREIPHNTALCGKRFSRLQPFVYLQAPILAWPTDCSDHQAFIASGHRAVYTGQYSCRYRS